MRILFFSHYFFPEGNAPATRVYEMCRRWVRLGHDVTVVTCAPNVPSGVVYEGYANRLVQRESVDGVTTVRVWTFLAANKGTIRRILNYFSYMVSATLAGLVLKRPDIVIATSPQFFCAWAGVAVSRLKRRPFVLEIRDLWPESIVAVGALRNRVLIRLLESMERRLYRLAACIVTVGEGYKQELVARDVPAGLVTVIPNGVDLANYDLRTDGGAVRTQHGLDDAFVCSYIGTIGMGCGLEVVLRAARMLRERGRSDIRFLLVGDGAVREALEARARQEGLSEIVFTGRQAKSRIPEYLAASDACLVHLSRTELFRSVMPSKIFEAAAMAKPIVLGVQGFAADVVRGAGAGICIEPEDERALVRALERLADDRAMGHEMGRSGHERIAKRHDSGNLARQYIAAIEACAPQLAVGKRRSAE